MSSEGTEEQSQSSGRSMRDRKRPNYRKMADVDEEPKKRGRPRKIPEVYTPVTYKQRPIILFTHPRSCSTAFEKAVHQLSGVEVEHEPYSQAFYYSSDRRTKNPGYTERPMNNKARTYKKVTAHLLRQTEGGRRVFAKDMAYYCHKNTPGAHFTVDEEVMTQLAQGGADFVFLIRKPEKAIASLDRMQKRFPEHYESGFQAEEVGIKELRDTFLYVRDTLKLPVVVIDADDLLNHPDKVLPLFCEAVQLTYTSSMINWSSKAPPMAWNEWKGWHEEAINSTTFVPPSNDGPQEQDFYNEDSERARDVRRALEDSQEAYAEMWSQRMVVA
jgi:hypothetical protein